MEWSTIGEIIAKYWVQQLCVIVLAVLTAQYNLQVRKFRKGMEAQKAIRLAMMALLRDRFFQGYKYYMRQGFYPISDREVMEDVYCQYHALGGNGVISHLKEELDDLPVLELGQKQ